MTVEVMIVDGVIRVFLTREAAYRAYDAMPRPRSMLLITVEVEEP